jgi:hypothetical protein
VLKDQRQELHRIKELVEKGKTKGVPLRKDDELQGKASEAIAAAEDLKKKVGHAQNLGGKGGSFLAFGGNLFCAFVSRACGLTSDGSECVFEVPGWWEGPRKSMPCDVKAEEEGC